MSKLSVWLVEFVNSLFPQPFNLENLHSAKLSVEAYQQHEYDEVIKIRPEFGEELDLQNKRVIDIGSGLGGMSLYYLEQGAALVTGIDIRIYSGKASQELIRSKHLSGAFSIVGDAACMPLQNECFDVAISINVFEHLDQVKSTLEDIYRVLRPGGKVFLHFCPFYSPWGAHLENWINFPWPHLLFSDRTLLTAAHRIEEKRNINSLYISTAQVEWSKFDKFPELNRLTIKGFRKLLKQTNFTILHSKMLPFGRHFLPKHKHVGGALLGFLMLLAKIPVIQEAITTKMVFVLSK